MRCRVHLAVVPVRHYDRELRTDVRRIVGYRWECRCGWRGPVRKTVALVRAESSAHDAAATSG
jgi:hypothetical protein